MAFATTAAQEKESDEFDVYETLWTKIKHGRGLRWHIDYRIIE